MLTPMMPLAAFFSGLIRNPHAFDFEQGLC